MRLFLLMTLASLAACSAGEDQRSGGKTEDLARAQADPADSPLRPASPPPAAAEGEWHVSDGTLTYVDAASGKATMVLSCAAGDILVSLPLIDTIGSEERLSFGGGGEVDTLVVETQGADSVRGEGPTPPDKRIIAILEAGPGASYGATAIGPLVPVPRPMAEAFVAGCA